MAPGSCGLRVLSVQHERLQAACARQGHFPDARRVSAGRTAPGRASSGWSAGRRACRRGGRSGRRRNSSRRRPGRARCMPYSATRYFAFIGMTKKSRMVRFGKIIANASSRPNRPPEAPTVGAAEPSRALTISCVSAAASDARRVELQEALLAPDLLELGAEHPQAQHVEEQVVEVPCRKRVGDDLPRQKPRAERPERERPRAGRAPSSSPRKKIATLASSSACVTGGSGSMQACPARREWTASLRPVWQTARCCTHRPRWRNW